MDPNVQLPSDEQDLTVRMRALEDLVAAQARRIDEQAEVIASLRTSDPSTTGTAGTGDSRGSAGMGRREVLGSMARVAAGAVAGGAVAVVATATPAAAVSGAFDSAVLATPALTATHTAAGTAAKVVSDGNTGLGLEALAGGLNGLGVSAKALGSGGKGIRGEGGIGVEGVSSLNGSSGVRGTSTGGGVPGALTCGVFGTTNGGDAFGTVGRGAGGGGTGVYGIGTKFGMRARAEAAAPATPPPFALPAGLVTEGVGTIAGAAAAGIRSSSTAGVGGEFSGAAANLHLLAGPAGPSRSHTFGHEVGEVAAEGNGTVWVCVAAGSAGQAGSWKRVAFVEDLPPGFDPGTLTGVFQAPPKPGRVYDSRLADGKLVGGASRTLSLATTLEGAEIVPSGSSAAVFTITLDQTEGSGFLSVFPSNVPFPGTSNVNWFTTGQILANGGTVTVPADRTVTVLAGGPGSTHFIVDVTGVYT